MVEKELKNEDILLNLKEINVDSIESFSSSHCSGRASFNFECSTDKGYCEDPNMTGKIAILDSKKDSEEGVYHLKVKFEKGSDDHE